MSQNRYKLNFLKKYPLKMIFKKIKETRLREILDEFNNKRRKYCDTCSEELKILKNDRQNVCNNKVCPMKGKKIAIYSNSIFKRVRIQRMTVLRILELFMMKFSKDSISYEL